jgi:hypothetical protein
VSGSLQRVSNDGYGSHFNAYTIALCAQGVNVFIGYIYTELLTANASMIFHKFQGDRRRLTVGIPEISWAMEWRPGGLIPQDISGSSGF